MKSLTNSTAIAPRLEDILLVFIHVLCATITLEQLPVASTSPVTTMGSLMDPKTIKTFYFFSDALLS